MVLELQYFFGIIDKAGLKTVRNCKRSKIQLQCVHFIDIIESRINRLMDRFKNIGRVLAFKIFSEK